MRPHTSFPSSGAAGSLPSYTPSSLSRQWVERGGGLALPSEHVPEGWLPRVVQVRDLTVLCLFAVLLVTNVPLIAAAGGAAYWYWLLGFVTFLIPSALVCWQLYRLFPGEAAVYLWANKAFGSFWDTFLGLFCNWWPGALGLSIEAGAVATSLQALNSTWLSVPWQQGLAEILVLLFAQLLCLLEHRLLQRILNVVFAAYLVMFLLLGVAGISWALAGHPLQGDFSAQGWQLQAGNYPVYGLVIVSLLGMAVPLNLGAEVISQREAPRYLLWGVGITIVVYLFATFGVLAVLPPKDLGNPAFLTEIFSATFGPAIGTFLGILNYGILVIYFVCATCAFNILFARLLLVAGIDRRLPSLVQRLSARSVPVWATLIQTLINVVFVTGVFLIAPLFSPSNQQLSFAVFLVAINGASVVWDIAMIGLFLCGILLCLRFHHQLKGRWVVPAPLLYMAAAVGIGASGVAIYSTFFAGSPLPQALSNADWSYWVLFAVLGSLALGAMYSFLVPEAEDLVVLAGKDEAVLGTNGTMSQEERRSLRRKEQHVNSFPAAR